MTLSKYIRVGTAYTRSVNIERDRQGSSTDRSYLPTTRAIQTLSRIAETLHDEVAPRSWALVGPYGSGKSAFGLFIARLLGTSDPKIRSSLLGLIGESDGALAAKLSDHLDDSRGYCVVPITGSPESLAKRLVRALLEASEAYLAGRRGPVPSFVKEMREAQNFDEVPVGNLIDWIVELQKFVSRAGGKGIVLVIDELGKFLEYEARHRQSTDIYLLQALAEHAATQGDSRLIVLVLLHQAFDQYFTSLGETLKNEWKKVQGRFESVPFLESSEQVLRVIREAISSDLPVSARRAVDKNVSRIWQTLEKAAALLPGLEGKKAKELFAGCYPLHPVSLLLLPVLCQKVAQNERTLFSFLGSTEPHGFQSALGRLEYETERPNWMMPWEIYEYFILNQPGLMSDTMTHRRWAEVVSAVERLGDAHENTIRLLKTIGLFNISGAMGGLKASDDLLRLCFDEAADSSISFEESLNELVSRSIVTYRKYNGEYRVWQGSDFDLEAALQVQRDQLAKIDLADVLNQRRVLAPVLARRHAIETGNLRYFQVAFVDNVATIATLVSDEPQILLCLSEDRDAEAEFESTLRGLSGAHHVVASIVANASMLRSSVTEVMAFERVRHSSPELAGDPIALRELADRQDIAADCEQELLASILEEPQASLWWWDGQAHKVANKRALQECFSKRLDSYFASAPKIQNELINREKPSATAIAARNKLFAAMLECSNEADLGFEKFPAEKSMYRALLRASGIHSLRASGGEWQFQPPLNSAVNLAPVWQEIEQFFDATEENPRSIAELFDALARPPYGVKRGVLPILFVAFYQAYSDEIAIYEGGFYCPFISVETVERLVKEPEAYSVQRFKIDHIRESLYKAYAESVSLMGDAPEHANLIAAAKPLAKFMMGLPDYTRRTKTISTTAQDMRDRFFASKSPLQLLFFQIPDALGFKPLIGVETNASLVADFQKKLAGVVSELRVAYHALLNGFLDQLRTTFFIDKKSSLDDVRGILKGRFASLSDYTIDSQGLKAFIGRLADPFGDESQWLISLASFLARKPPEKWTDDDAVAVEYRLVEFAKRIRDLETLRHYYEGNKASATDVEFVLLKSVSQSREPVEVVVALDDNKKKILNSTMLRVKEICSELENQELVVALLAMLVDEQRPSVKTDETNPGFSTASGIGNLK